MQLNLSPFRSVYLNEVVLRYLKLIAAIIEQLSIFGDAIIAQMDRHHVIKLLQNADYLDDLVLLQVHTGEVYMIQVLDVLYAFLDVGYELLRILQAYGFHVEKVVT